MEAQSASASVNKVAGGAASRRITICAIFTFRRRPPGNASCTLAGASDSTSPTFNWPSSSKST